MNLDRNILIVLCGIFYSVLCVFSIVAGQMYASGKKEMNPLGLSDDFLSKYDTAEKMKKFTIKMGWVTFVVGLVQGLSAYCCFVGNNLIAYLIIMGFTLFSIASVLFKLKGKINAFPIIKLVFYLLILIVLLLNSTRSLYL